MNIELQLHGNRPSLSWSNDKRTVHIGTLKAIWSEDTDRLFFIANYVALEKSAVHAPFDAEERMVPCVRCRQHCGNRDQKTPPMSSLRTIRAAIVGSKAISETWAEEPGITTPITVSIVPVEHQVTLKQIKTWVEKSAGSPKEAALRFRLKELLTR